MICQLNEAAGTSTPKPVPAADNLQRNGNAANSIYSNIKRTLVYKWQLRFSGDKGSIGVNEFIERAEELSEAR